MKIVLLLSLGAALAAASSQDTFHAVREFAKGNVLFTADVYRELLKVNTGNFIVSPLSADVVLALAQIGAEGETASQLAASLHTPTDRERVKTIFKEVISALSGNEDYDLNSANKIYVAESFKISDAYQKEAQEVFDAEVQNLNFENGEEAADKINRWVAGKTQNKIQNLFGPTDLDASTKAVLLNALYFRGSWVKKFDEAQTKKRPFHVDVRNEIETSMMEVSDEFDFYDSPELDAKFLSMPYEGGDVSLVVVLPNKVEGLGQLESQLAKVLTAPKFSQQKVDVVLPKFQIKSSIKFKPILKALGVELAFSENADFSRIGAHQEGLAIDDVIQKAFIEVEEKGTVAAAATAVEYGFRSALARKIEPVPFVADHPFLFYLTRHPDEEIIFVGRFANPAS